MNSSLNRRSIAAVLAASALLPLAASPALAQTPTDFPRHSIRMIVGFAAGGISDVLARAITAKMTVNMGQTVYVDNKPGAGTTIAADAVAKAVPDGYTIILQDVTTHAINATLYKKLPYDSVKDFTTIDLFGSTPLMLVVNPSSPAKNVKELAAYLKASPGKYSYGSSGSGTIVHLSGEMFKVSQGVDAVHIPYKGSSPATQAILSNEVAFVFSTMPPAVANAKAGTLRALAVTTPKRVAAAPDVPTMAEAGVPNFEVVLYSGLMGPKGMDPAVVAKLATELNKAIASPEVKKVFDDLGVDSITSTPEGFRDMLGKEIARYAPIVKESGATVD